ncbi:pentapeptide repeat-containing protein [Furfurilactobacillus entadae]|uniref:pentapeptide repeat-containing protein n=1 Tax=Furfurilactobacillus entadae TaxID=2922307 RepID=UPI0038B2BABB
MITQQTLPFDAIEDSEHYDQCTFLPANDQMRAADIVFTACTFQQTDFRHSEWLDCTFDHCDFGNTHFDDSVLYRDVFTHCNLLGTDFLNNTWKDSHINGCRADYSNFSGSKLTACATADTSFNGASFIEVTFKDGFSTTSCAFNDCSFIGTWMNKVDLSASEFSNLEFNPGDIRGLIINQFQASLLIGQFGVVLKA